MKKIVLVAGILIVIGVICVFYDNEAVIVQNNKSEVAKNALTMLYETSAGSGEYTIVDEESWDSDKYIFNQELSYCENGSELVWDDLAKSIKLNVTLSDKCYIFFDACKSSFADYLKGLYDGDGVNNLYLHDGSGSYENASQEAKDNSYRYAGANPSNYVCFGSDEETCPVDNLYRVIGIFDEQVKLIKYDYLNTNLLNSIPSVQIVTSADFSPYYKGTFDNVYTYAWNSFANHSWQESSLQLALNSTMLNNLAVKWQNLIANTSWQIRELSYDLVYQSNVSTIFNYELGGDSDKDFVSKIGLMYISDYGYAASPENWNTSMQTMNNDSNRNNNWMYMGGYEWTISIYQEESNYAFFISKAGAVGGFDVTKNRAIRPVFYLTENVNYDYGDGSQNNPYRIV